MTDTKISALPSVVSIVGTEIVPVAKAGTTQGATVNQIKTYLGVSGINTGDQDLSGLVTKVTTVNGHALSSNVTVTATDVGLGNVDNTSDANKPISTATATALSGKQDTLVSGTNIKTVGGVSLLGSGNITVGTGTVTSVSVVSANGLSGTVATNTTTPAITLTTSVTGVLKGNGTALSAATAGTDYTSPTGTENLTNKTITSISLRETKVAMGANDINCSVGNVFSKTISGTTTLTVSNVPSTGNAFGFILDLTNGGSATVTWWSGMKWAAGTAPTLTASGRDVLGFITHDGGTTWNGFLLGKGMA